MSKVYLGSVVLFWVCAAVLFANNQETAIGSLNSAEEWAQAVVGIVTDPHFYHLDKETMVRRFAPLVALEPVHKNLMGRNRSHGILHVAVQCCGEFQNAVFLMPLADAQHREVYPLVRAKLLKKLRSPWSYKIDDADKDLILWRKGDSRFIVYLEKSDYAVDPFGPAVPEPGPYVVVTMGEEQGESEDP